MESLQSTFTAFMTFDIVIFLGWVYVIVMTPKHIDCLPLFAISCVLLVPVATMSNWLYKAKYDQEFIKEWLLDHKPTCHEETIDCMNDKIKWYNDSLQYIVPFDHQKKVSLDSLKNELNRFEDKSK